MIAEWMLYCSLCALGLFAAAMVAERALIAAGGPVRHVWIGALALSLIIPVATYELAPRPTVAAVTMPLTETIAPVASAENTVMQAAPRSASVVATPPVSGWKQNLRMLKRADGVFAAVWIALSSALALYFLVGIVALKWMRRRWEAREVCGIPVLVSEHTGPAVVGAITPVIVMPEWALAMAPQQLSLMIRHEQEHRRAGDPQLLTLAQLALIAMPWNAALWWVIVRLGMAVELDCDARVLRDADPRSYGDLLLEVARPRRAPRFIIATAFAERAGQLERRIRAIAGRRERVSRGARAAVALVALAVISIAWAAPHPAVPPRPSTSRPAEPPRPPAGQARALASGSNSLSSSSASLDIAKHVEIPVNQPAIASGNKSGRTPTFRGDTVILLPNARLTGEGLVMHPIAPPAAPRLLGPRVTELDSAVFNRLFDGVTLTPAQEAKARELINRLAEIQAAQDRTAMIASMQMLLARLNATAQRDAALRALLTNDADIATLDARLAQFNGGGRRGRSSSDSPPVTTEVPVGGGRGGGGGRAGAGGGRVGGGGVNVLTEVPLVGGSTIVTDVIFMRLFGGITLSPEQQTAARTLITEAQQQLSALNPEPPMAELRLLPQGGVLMRPESRAAVLDILGNDADRSLVDSRIVSETRVVRTTQPPPTP